MGIKSKISWTNDTWNPWRGCAKISQGCKNCYMFPVMTDRLREDPTLVRRAADSTFRQPYSLPGPFIFTCSLGDFFIEQADPWRDEAWDIIKWTPHLTYQILTKRPENIRDRLPADWGDGYPNVWLGVSVEQTTYKHRIIELSSNPAVIRFVSYEPALEYVDFKPHAGVIDWLISGGESPQPDYRPADPEWFRRVRDDCLSSDIIYFHKQNGGRPKINGVAGGDMLDGQVYHNWPERSKVIKQGALF